jgi:hypothetical protein
LRSQALVSECEILIDFSAKVSGFLRENATKHNDRKAVGEEEEGGDVLTEILGHGGMVKASMGSRQHCKYNRRAEIAGTGSSCATSSYKAINPDGLNCSSPTASVMHVLKLRHHEQH